MTSSRRTFLRNSLGLYAGLMGLNGRLLAVDFKNTSSNIPIKNIVVILRENHSYDNYFGSYDKGNGKILGNRCQDKQPDPPHLRNDALRGASTSTQGDCHYLEEDIPNYFRYAREFTLCDNYFGEARASSYPNYFMLMAAQTPTLDHIREKPTGKFDIPTIADRLTDKGVLWKNYDGGIPLVKMFKKPYESGNIVSIKEFDHDARKGLLPPVSWVTPNLGNSEHPPYSVRTGEQWTVDRINAVMQGPQWADTAIFIVWDEWGGFDDHVVPPDVEKGPFLSGPQRYGYRIPFLVISPFAKKGHVAHTLYSHSSILRTIERIFDVPSLTEWDAKANDLLDCFDFAQERLSPLIL
ncbi:MAG: phospholipase C [Burkholderiaceae bacterium]